MKSVFKIVGSKAATAGLLLALPLCAQVPLQLRSASGYPTGNFIGPTALWLSSAPIFTSPAAIACP